MVEPQALSGWEGALALAVVGIGTVFACLLLTYVFFTITGRLMKRRQERKSASLAATLAGPGAKATEIPEPVVAAIALAISQVWAAQSSPLAAGTGEPLVGSPWKEEGRILQHRRSRRWEQR